MENKEKGNEPRLYRRVIRFDHKRRQIWIVDRMRKISRKRFIGLAMYHGFPPRVAREMADVVCMHGASYQKGYRMLVKAINEVLLEEEKEGIR